MYLAITNLRNTKHHLSLIWDHTVLPANRHHRSTWPILTPANQAGVLDLPTPEGWKAELTLVIGYMFTCLQTVIHPTQAEAKPITPQPLDHKYDVLSLQHRIELWWKWRQGQHQEKNASNNEYDKLSGIHKFPKI